MDSKIERLQRQVAKDLEEVKEETIDFLKLQETEIANLNAKVSQIDEEMQTMLVGDETQSRGSRQSRTSRLEHFEKLGRLNSRDYYAKTPRDKSQVSDTSVGQPSQFKTGSKF